MSVRPRSLCSAVFGVLFFIPALVAPERSAADAFGSCGEPATRIHEIQGSGLSSPLRGASDVVVEAVVVGDFQGFPDGLGGFFLQEEDADVDEDPATSEGLFVFDSGFGADVAPGDTIRVRGTVGEFFGLTELRLPTELTGCEPRGRASAVPVQLPVSDDRLWERWEGMRVRVDQTLVASEHFDLERFGELDLAAGERLWQPTHWVAPGDRALEMADRNARRRILLDDGTHEFYPSPVPHTSTRDGALLRLGDRVTHVAGVVDFAFGRYRIHPLKQVTFAADASRTESPPEVAGTLRIVSWNVHNFFNGDGRGGGFPTRGAKSAEELERQRAKLVETLVRLDSDVLALTELENDGTELGSAIRELVDGLDERSPDSEWIAVEHGRSRLGSSAISVGLLYRKGVVRPVGSPAVLDSGVHPNFDSTRNRPSLAQTFEHRKTGERLTVVVNHLKSKGSPCDSAGDPDLGDGQGRCNATRTRAAGALVEWLKGDPTGSGGAPVLIVGDLNAYPHEDPVRAIEAAGFVDLLDRFTRADTYTFVFDGQAGRLDHALAQEALLPGVGGAAVWHTNTDEPQQLDYRSDAEPDSATPFRASDHDPVLIGLFPDWDGDGVIDTRDACPESLLTESVVLGECDSGAPNLLSPDGCTLSDDLIPAAGETLQRGEELQRTRSLLENRVAGGALTAKESHAIWHCLAKRGAEKISGASCPGC